MGLPFLIIFYVDGGLSLSREQDWLVERWKKKKLGAIALGLNVPPQMGMGLAVPLPFVRASSNHSPQRDQ